MHAFAALADPVRRDLLLTLAGGSARVVDLAAAHPISRPAVSRHLRLLTGADLVGADDVGRERHYRLRPDGLAPVLGWLDELDRAAWPSTRRATTVLDGLDALDLEVRRAVRDRGTDDAVQDASEETA